jgi:hypothetical protein
VALSIKGDAIVGVWPYVRTERLSISFLRNPALTPYLGPHVFFPADLKGPNRDSFDHDVMADLLAQIPNADVWGIQPGPSCVQAGLFRAYGLNLGVHQTFLIPLKDGEAPVFSAFKDSLRRNIRGAEADYTISYDAKTLPLLYEWGGKTLFQKRLKQHYNLGQMQPLLDACIKHKKGHLMVARDAAGDASAVLWNVWDKDTSYYLMGARRPGSEDYRSLSLLLWQAMRDGIARGNAVFDMEGSMDPGVERFFRSFGGRRSLYLMLRKSGHPLWKMLQLFRR